MFGCSAMAIIYSYMRKQCIITYTYHTPPHIKHSVIIQEQIQDYGKGGSNKYIHKWGGYGRGCAPPVTARGTGRSTESSPLPQPLFKLLRLF